MIPTVHRLNGSLPLLESIEAHPWENKVTFNPASVLVDDRAQLNAIIPSLPFDRGTLDALRRENALCFLLYRAQGKKTPAYDHTRSSLGLAVLTADLRLLARHTAPVLLPDRDYDNLGVEDARITRVGDRFEMLYTAYATTPDGPRIRIARASTENFVAWKKQGPLAGDVNTVDNKNAMLFPETINGKHILLHRPMEGPDRMMIHWAESEAVDAPWKTRGVLLRPVRGEGFVDTWVGGGAPPLRAGENRYLMIYHYGNRKADGAREYDLGIALLDTRSELTVVRRDEPLLRPSTAAETVGDAELGVNNVVFICGAHFSGADLYFPYAGADSVILAGKIEGADVKRYLEEDTRARG
jgi:predicted GH43/DUF377 family glycosyl hydrolase